MVTGSGSAGDLYLLFPNAVSTCCLRFLDCRSVMFNIWTKSGNTQGEQDALVMIWSFIVLPESAQFFPFKKMLVCRERSIFFWSKKVVKKSCRSSTLLYVDMGYAEPNLAEAKLHWIML